ncbi:hypothetical protein VNI00_008582 [Paramarasmius palmivorus]|uniref:BZIP domain-containing protein n=1 Tax=Paramarasmius palmivorus TaxID=297713 RepID=A0AAW0CXC2_9AGAR
MPSHLNGLNIIHPSPPQVDSQDLSSSSFPDLSAQLALWTNLPFESEESPTSSGDGKVAQTSIEEDEEEKAGTAPHESHVNVVTGSGLGSQSQVSAAQHQSAFDFNTLLSGFNLDALQHQQQQQTPHSAPAVSLAQLLALHSLTQGTPMYTPSLTHPQPIQPAPTLQPSSSQQSAASSSTSGSSGQSPSDVSPPPAKRARARKASVSVTESSVDSADASVSSLNAAEDKRRRNTAASARFRLKKKEREIALENKAKELEVRVSELERECEGLRRENGWLKGLVVGVTGAAQQSNGTTGSQQTQSPPVLAGMRRPREGE